MFTKWQQVEDWIIDNRFQRWIFYKNNPDNKADGERSNDKIVDSKFYNDDPREEKLHFTQKYLEQWGNRAYGVAFQSTTATTGGAQCVVCLEVASAQPSATANVGAIGATVDVEAIKAQVREQIQTEFDKREYERERKKLDQERKEFERDKNSAIGVMVGYLKPIIEGLGQRRVAGVDSTTDVQAHRITPIEDEQPEQEQFAEEVQEQEQSVFTDEEGDKLFSLMERLKAVEPDYMQMLEAVVTMAEANDSTYQMARSFLLKK